MKKILLSGIVILFGFSLMAQTAMLRMNLEKNKTYCLKSLSDQTVSQTINGNQQSTDSKVNYVLTLKMIDSTPEFIVAEMRFDTLITTTNAMGKIMEISSVKESDIKSSEAADVLSCVMNRLSKNAMYVKLDYSGKPIEIVNARMLSDVILKDTASIALTGPTAAAIKSQAINTVNESSLKTMIEGFTWSLPGKQVSKGEKWTRTQKTFSGGMMLDVITTYQLEGIENNYANITAESAIKASDNAAPIKSGGASVSYGNLQGLSKSTLIIDTMTGLIVSENAKTHIAGELAISAPGFSMQMPMDINSESKLVLVK